MDYPTGLWEKYLVIGDWSQFTDCGSEPHNWYMYIENLAAMNILPWKVNAVYKRAVPCENVFWAYANSKCPDQTAHPGSYIRTFTGRSQNHWILQNVHVWMESKGPDDTLRMRRSESANSARAKALFRLTRQQWFILWRNIKEKMKIQMWFSR